MSLIIGEGKGMKISNLKIKNIKCFKEADISFENENGDIKNWSLVVGNIGVLQAQSLFQKIL